MPIFFRTDARPVPITPDEQADEFLLADVFARREVIDCGAEGMAETLYRLRTIWIGGLCLPWGMLTQGQRDGYKAEVYALITKAKGE